MRVARKARAAQFAANVLPIIRDIQAAGHTSLNAIGGQLNARQVATASGGQWRHVQVLQILARASGSVGTDTDGRPLCNLLQADSRAASPSQNAKSVGAGPRLISAYAKGLRRRSPKGRSRA
jgi:hypothetical protein